MQVNKALLLGIAILVSGCAATPDKQATSVEPLYFPAPPDQPRFVFERTVMASADIEKPDRESHMRRMLTGESESGKTLAKPFDVTVCKGQVFVSDTVRRSVMVFNVPEGRFFEIGTEEPGVLRKPLGLDTDGDCNLYVADGTTRQIMVYEPTGRYLKSLGGQQWFELLSHVAVDPAGTRLFAVDTGGVGSQAHRVRVFDAGNGEHLRDIGIRGSGDGEFNLPRDIEIGPDQRLYVVDGGNFRVQVLEQDGRYLRSIGSLGRRYGQFARPKGAGIDPQGNVYVSDSAHGNFQVFDPEGRLLLFVGERSEKFDRAVYMLPAGIDVDEDGRVYMVDQYFRKLDIYRPADLKVTDGFLGSWELVSQQD